MPRVGDLEIYQDLDFERREWRVQRIGWGVMAVIILAALLGLLGKGPLSGTSARSSGELLQVEYNRFLHFHAAEMLKCQVSGKLAENGELRLWIDQAFAEAHEIKSVVPAPSAVESSGDRYTYVFRVTSDATMRITFYYEPETRGAVSAKMGVGAKHVVEFSQFVYP